MADRGLSPPLALDADAIIARAVGLWGMWPPPVAERGGRQRDQAEREHDVIRAVVIAVVEAIHAAQDPARGAHTHELAWIRAADPRVDYITGCIHCRRACPLTRQAEPPGGLPIRADLTEAPA
jgi:hypothetical protein